MPFDVALSLEPRERLAWVVIMGRLTGGTFDWATETWMPQQ